MDAHTADDRLMEAAIAGDTSAFDEIVRRHQRRVQSYAIRMLGGDSAGGADIAVGAFLRLWEHRRSYRPCGRLAAWLLKTTHRLCLDAIQETHGPPGLEDPMVLANPLGAAVERTALSQAVRDAVMSLPETHRSVLILSVYEEMPYDTISEILEIPAGTVASRRNSAIEMLRRRLAAWETL